MYSKTLKACILYYIDIGFCLSAREALAHHLVLNMPDRADWKACQLSKDAEIDMVNGFREKFRNYDFTLD